MKECRRCGACYEDVREACGADGAPLVPGLPGPVTIDGKYHVERRLGQGGMGIVYRVTHMALRRTFALKLIRGVSGPEDVARFRVEAEVLGKLKHPHIVDVTDFGVDPRDGGIAYLVMEFLSGRSFGECLRSEGVLPPARALRLLPPVAFALDFAHERGVLHRDLKPDNVFVAEAAGVETVKILDFGLARLLPSAAARLDPVHDSRALGALSDGALELEGETLDVRDATAPLALARDRLTRPGSLAGTPSYMAPELFGGKDASRASDVYAFGVMAYELMTGRVPFKGSLTEVQRAHAEAPPEPPSRVRGDLPAELDRALLEPLDKEPGRRPPSARAFVERLQHAERRAFQRSWRARELPRRAVLAAVIALFSLLGAPWLWDADALRAWERSSVDLRFSLRPARSPDPRLVLVVLDEASLDADKTPLALKADEFAAAIDGLFEANARAVAIDLLLPEKFAESAAFSRAILAHAGLLALAVQSTPDGSVGTECLGRLTAAALGPEQASALFGFVNLEPDPDGVTRQARTSYAEAGGTRRDTWAARAAKLLGPIPAGAPERFWIDHSAAWRGWRRRSWKDLRPALERDPEQFRGKLVLIGGDFPGSGDEARAMPGRSGDTVPGVVIQALATETILSGFPIREASRAPVLAGCGLALLAAGLGLLCLSRIRYSSLALVFVVAAYTSLALAAFRGGWLLPLAGPVASLLIAAAVAMAFRLRLSPVPAPVPDVT